VEEPSRSRTTPPGRSEEEKQRYRAAPAGMQRAASLGVENIPLLVLSRVSLHTRAGVWNLGGRNAGRQVRFSMGNFKNRTSATKWPHPRAPPVTPLPGPRRPQREPQAG